MRERRVLGVFAGDLNERGGRAIALTETRTPNPRLAGIGSGLAGLPRRCSSARHNASAPFVRHAMSSQTWTTTGGRGESENIA